MTQQLEKTWAGKVLTADELKQYSELQIQRHHQHNGKEKFLQQRSKLIALIKKNLDEDPGSDIGITLGKEWMAMIHDYYGDENSDLQDTIWKQGYKKGKIEGKQAMDPAVIKWIDQAGRAYCQQRIKALLYQVEQGKQSDAVLKAAWANIMQDICGDSLKVRQSIYDSIMADEQTSSVVKQWLKNLCNE